MRLSKTFQLSLFIAFLLALFAVFTTQVQAQDPQPSDKIPLYFFWGDGCPHCAEAKPVLDDMAKRIPQMELRSYEVWRSDANLALLEKIAEANGFKVGGVPTFLVGDQHFVGYSEQIGEQIEAAVRACIGVTCPDPGAGVIPGVPAGQVSFAPGETQQPAEIADDVIELPFIGQVDLMGKSLWISTALIAFVDGFNPCSLWVLSILLALTLHTGSRKKVAIIGVVFITVTAAIYALFIAGLFTILTIVSFVGWVQVLVALIALFFGAVNIKDYFFYKEGLSFTIDDEKKPGIYQRIRRVMDGSQSTWGLIGATAVLAAGVSLVEFSCTAGFPVLWTNLVSAQQVTPLTFGLLLLLYMVIYQIDELVIFFSAAYTLKISRVEEKHGRILKLIGGMLMLTLAGVMLVNPALMNNLGNSLLIFAIAFAAAGLVLLLHRRILPSFGIWIGTEKPKKRHARSRKS